MLIAQITDTHITQPNVNEPRSLARMRALASFVAHIKALDEKPDLVLHTGDVVHDGKAQDYEIVKAIMGSLPMPTFFAVGNRDERAGVVAGLKDLGGMGTADGFVQYSIDGFPVRLIAVDTQHRERNIGTTCSVRLATLEDMLKEEPDIPTALFMHHPPFEVTTAKDPFQFDDRILANAFLDMVAHHKQVVHVFCGHMHREFSVELETCVATTTPSLPVDNRISDGPLEDHPLYQLHRWNGDTVRFETTTHAAILS